MWDWGIFVPGTPKPQGSVRAYSARGKAYVAANHSDSFARWRNSVIDRAATSWKGEPLEAAEVFIRFVFKPPKSWAKWYREHPMSHVHHKRPDIDKLARAVLDGLTAAGVLADDSNVCQLNLIKQYTDAAHPDEGADIAINAVPLPTRKDT